MRRALLLAVVAVVATCGSAAGAKPSAQPRFSVPFGIATIGRMLYVSDWPNGRVLRFDARARRLSVFARGFREPTDMLAAGGVLYLTEFKAGRVVRLDTRGRRTTVARLPLPTGIAVHGRTLYVGSLANYVYRVDLDSGAQEIVAGDGTDVESGDGGPARNARVRGPHGLGVDAAGNVYLQADGVRRIDAATGRIERWSRRSAFKLAPAPDGSVYFIDGDPNTGVVGRFLPDGTPTELWRGRKPPTDLELQNDGRLLFGLGEPGASVRRLDPRSRRVTVVVRSR